VSIYSDEPEDAKGNGDGNTDDDILIGGQTSFERPCRACRRRQWPVYGITFVVTDASGNTTTATAFVGVPHDQSGDRRR